MSVRRRLMRSVRLVRRGRSERGAYAVLFSMMLILVVALAAIAVDIASQVASKQQLKDTMDAAAHAGAYALPDKQLQAADIVNSAALANDPDTSVTTDLWCVIASTGAAKTPQYTQIPSTCKPHGSKPYAGTKCDEAICFIPCRPTLADPSIKCNTIRVADSKVVPYAFAPAIGYDQGETGAVVSIACKGTCGTESPNPLDIVIMADRTPSMLDDDRNTMKSAIEDSLTVMNPELQYVALGTIHKSSPRRMNKNSAEVCATAESGVEQVEENEGTGRNPRWVLQWNRDNTPKLQTTNNANQGDWIAVPFSANYLTGPSGSIRPTDPLVKGLRCMPGAKSGNYGTHLASALKGAARYLLGDQPNNLWSLPTREYKAKKVIIFETDGSPDEVLTNGYKSLSSSTDFGAGRNSSRGDVGCDNLARMAEEVKKKDIMIISIGFGKAGTARCKDGDDRTERVRDVLARVASDAPDGGPSTASDCSKDKPRADENKDGDFFFCAAEGAELEEIFRSAFGSLTKGIKFVRMPK